MATKTKTKRSTRGRKALPEQDRKKKMYIFTQNKVVDYIGEDECKRIAENAILNAYKNGKSNR